MTLEILGAKSALVVLNFRSLDEGIVDSATSTHSGLYANLLYEIEYRQSATALWSLMLSTDSEPKHQIAQAGSGIRPM